MKFGVRQELKSVMQWKSNSKRKSMLTIWVKSFVEFAKRKTLLRNSSVSVSVYNEHKFHVWKKEVAQLRFLHLVVFFKHWVSQLQHLIWELLEKLPYGNKVFGYDFHNRTYNSKFG